MAERGRPIECTEAMAVEVCSWLAKGCSIKATCKIVGIPQETFFNWRKRGADGEEPFASFSERVTRAIGDGLAGRVSNIAGAGDWRADAWMLERMHPDEFGKRTELVGKDGGPVQVHDVTAAIDAELARRSSADLGIPDGVIGDDG
jgi:hypothetical protein